jgi:hypothetical protein
MKKKLLLIVPAFIGAVLIATVFAKQNCPAAKPGCELTCPQYSFACDRNKDQDREKNRDCDKDPNKNKLCAVSENNKGCCKDKGANKPADPNCKK